MADMRVKLINRYSQTCETKVYYCTVLQTFHLILLVVFNPSESAFTKWAPEPDGFFMNRPPFPSPKSLSYQTLFWLGKQIIKCVFSDNVFAIKSWTKKKFSFDDSRIDKAFGIPEDFDYMD